MSDRVGCLLILLFIGLVALSFAVGLVLYQPCTVPPCAWIESGPRLEPPEKGPWRPPADGVLPGHGVGRVGGFTEDGTRLVTVGRHGLEITWDVSTGRELGYRRDAGAWPRRSSAEPVVLPGSGDRLVLEKRKLDWPRADLLRRAANTDAEVFRIGAATDFDVSRDGRLVLVLSDRSGGRAARLWDLETGTELRRFIQDREILGARLSEDATRVVTVSEGGAVTVWDVGTRRRITTITGHPEARRARFGPADRTVLTSGGDGTARLWDAETGALRQVFGSCSAALSDVGFDPAGRPLVAGACGRTAWLWRPDEGPALSRFVAHDADVAALALFPDGRLATGCAVGRVRLWRSGRPGPARIYRVGEGPVRTLAGTPDGRSFLTGSLPDENAVEWDLASGRRLRAFGPHAYQEVCWARYSPDGVWLLTEDAEPQAILWNLATGVCRGRYRGREGDVAPLGFPRSGPGLYLGTPDGGFQLREEGTGDVIRPFPRCPSRVRVLATDPAAPRLAAAYGSGTLRLFDADSAELLGEVPLPGGALTHLAFSPDGRLLLAAGARGVVFLLGTDPLALRARLLALADGSAAILTPDGRYAASHDGDPPGIYWLEAGRPRALRDSPLRSDPGLWAELWR